MKKVILLIGLLSVFNFALVAQPKIIEYESFDNTSSFVFTSSSVGYTTWLPESDLYVSYPYAYKGQMPTASGTEVILESPPYDLSGYSDVYLRFSHICKIDPQDTVRIEYAYQMGTGFSDWEPLLSRYLGQASNYTYFGFNANSYPDWEAANLATKPTQEWWKEELFDLKALISTNIKFRFVLKKGSAPGTSVSYGWLIDNFEIIASNDPITFPTIEFIAPIVKNDVYHTGPFNVEVKVVSNTSASMQIPYLKYTAVTGNSIVKDSLTMINSGFGLWKAVIPQQYLNTHVHYSIHATDMNGNRDIAYEDFAIVKNDQYGNNSVALLAINNPTQEDTQLPSSPIKISIQNKGAFDLDTITVFWKVNNNPHTSFGWKGNLPWNYQDNAITIGTYTPTANAFDTLWVWLENPNQVQDIVTEDDTLCIVLYGCSSTMNPVYTIGQGQHFSSLSLAVEALKRCGVADNIAFELEDGTYPENIDLSELNTIMGSYQLTITSAQGNDNVVIKPVSGVGITLGKTNNVTIENITIDVSLGTHAIAFTDACSNITIRNNTLKSKTMGTGSLSGSPIYKGDNSGKLNNIVIEGNTIEGGYSGITLYGGTSVGEGTNIKIDNNILKDQYHYGLYLFNNQLTSVSNNTITSRNTGSIDPNRWEGISVNYSNGHITANKIHQQNPAIKASKGIFIENMNVGNTLETGSIINNEIIITSESISSGIHLFADINASILHNSVYIGGSGASNGILVTDNPNIKTTIENNHFTTDALGSYPIYLGSTNYLNNWNIDYNNYYSPDNIGYANGAKTSLDDWKNTVSSDVNSTDSLPDYIDNTVSLELNTYIGLACSLNNKAETDIKKIQRTKITTMGCYAGALYPENASLIKLINWGNNNIQGLKDTIKVVLINSGSSALNGATIEWMFNNGISTQVTSSKVLSFGDTAIIELGEVQYNNAGNNTLKAWIVGSGNTYLENDTISIETHICDSVLNGTYVVGIDFNTLEEAITRIYSCGIKGAVVLQLQDGTYPESISLLGQIPGSSPINTVTITSLSGNKEDVTIQPSNQAGVILGEVSNIIIDGITIDAASSGTYGIEFAASVNNIEINNTIVKANLSETTRETGYAAVYKGMNTGTANDIRFVNNTLDGGYNGFEFYGNSSNNYDGITLENNIISNQYNVAITAQYTNFSIITRNTLLSKTNAQAPWQGMELQYCNGDITSNSIKQRSDAITSPIGIVLTQYNQIGNPALIANNEIILSNTAIGLLVNNNVAADILHNSIYMDGTDASKGIQTNQNVGADISIQNNNIITRGENSYPVYLSNTTNLPYWSINYNNMLAPTYIGYADGNKSTFQEWRQTVSSDLNSVSTEPIFKNIQTSMELISSRGILCPVLSTIPTDIRDTVRTSLTTMGAYHFKQAIVDAAPVAFVSPTEYYNTGDSLSITIKNTGVDPITSLTINWDINGTAFSKPWTGTLVQGAISNTIVLENNLTLSDVINNITVWTSNPNATADDDVLNDTIKLLVVVCGNGLSGNYTVGAQGRIPNLKTVANILTNCGVNGPVEFSLLEGIHDSLLLGNINGTSNVNTITFQPNITNTNDATITGIKFDTINNIVIKDLTIKATDIAAIEFKAPANNIEIRNCNIIANLVTQDTVVGAFGIYKPENTNNASNILITGNTITGGYAGIYFYGNNDETNYGSNIMIDSNAFTNQYHYGLYLRYIDAANIDHNSLVSRPGSKNDWIGMDANYVNAVINANKFKTLDSNGRPTAIALSNFNHLHTTEAGMIANNEIILKCADGYSIPCINLKGAVTGKIIHNSIYSKGSRTKSIAITNNPNDKLIIKNNIFVTLGGSFAIPINLEGTGNRNLWDFDYNSYHSDSNRICQLGNNIYINSLPSWRKTINGDKHAVTINPGFGNNPSDLALSDFTGLACPAFNEVNADINNKERIVTTSMGCYAMDHMNVNAQLASLLNWDPVLGQKDSLKVVLKNGGTTPITDVDFSYSFNNTTESSSWNGNLAFGDSVVITLRQVEYVSGRNLFTVWIDTLNKGQDIDQYLTDDTLSVSIAICTGNPMNGRYVVDENGTREFSSIEEAVEQLYACGISGPVTIALVDGDYRVSVVLEGAIPGSTDTNIVTFTSLSGDSSSVKIQRAGTPAIDEAAFILNGVSNIVLSKLTLDGSSIHTPGVNTYATEYSKAVTLIGGCDNIEITNCHLTIAFTTLTSGGMNELLNAVYAHQYAAISKPPSSGIITNIRIINNLIEGGSRGISLDASASDYNKNIYILDNIIQEVDYGAVYLSYTDSVNVENNTITQRTTSPWPMSAIYFADTYGKIIGNRIKLTLTGNGIYLSNATNSLLSRCLVVNNEIIGSATGNSARSGINVAKSRADIYHNSVYLTGTGRRYGLQVANDANTFIDVQNNNFVISSSDNTSFPAYLATAVTGANVRLANYYINHNNYHAINGTNVGAVGGTGAAYIKADMGAWSATVTYDTNSVSVNPNFSNPTQNLEYITGDNLKSPLLNIPEALIDIKGIYREDPSCIGAYEYIPAGADILPYELISPYKETQANGLDSVVITLQNVGRDTIHSVDIVWTVGNTTQTYPWTGTLAFGEISAPVKLGDFTPGSRKNSILVYTSNPNGAADLDVSNDTIRSVTYGCDSIMNGIYTIGLSQGNHFEKITDFVQALYACGINAPVVAQIQDGTYFEAIELSESVSGSSTQNTITFTSASQDATAVTIQRPDDGRWDIVPFALTGISNIVVSHLTLSALTPTLYSSAKAITIQDGSDNIEISNCILQIPSFENSTASSEDYTVIRQLGSGIISNIRITDNVIEGGAYGIYMKGVSNANRNQTILIQNNIIDSVGSYGIYAYWSDNVDIINNSIRQRIHSQKHDFTGIYYYYSTGNKVINNRIKADSVMYGMYLYYLNSGSANNALVANNEIIVKKVRIPISSNNPAGLYISSSKADVLHNSVLTIEGGRAAICISASSLYPFTLKNNIFTTLDSSAYAIYANSSPANVIDAVELDYNNYYAPVNIGSLIGTGGGEKETIQDWQTAVTTDLNSISIKPIFKNSSISLELDNISDVYCPIIANAGDDITGSPRMVKTLMGAYGIPAADHDAYLFGIVDVPEEIISGQVYYPRVLLQNLGTSPLTKLEVGWALNTTPQTPVAPWTGSLDRLETDTMPLNSITAINGLNELMVWVTAVNNLTDEFDYNDTIRISFHACDSLLKGDYTIGSSGEFSSFTDAITRIHQCGIGGDIRFWVEEGTYRETVDLTNIHPLGGPYSITIQPIAGDSVSIRPALSERLGIGIKLGKTTNVTIEGITIDMQDATGMLTTHYGIYINNEISNIIINDCIILSSTVSTLSDYQLIYKENTGTVNNVQITNNTFSKGSRGINLVGGAGSSLNNSNIIIDSNIFIEQYESGIQTENIDFISMAYNQITRLSSNGIWHGIRLAKSEGPIYGNRINYKGTRNAHGITLGEHNLKHVDNALIANNEIIINASHANSSIGINVTNNAKIDIIHNSILVKSTVAADRGIFISSTTNGNYSILNNNIEVEFSAAYPIYFDGTIDLNNLTVNYNNYYAPTFVGFVNGTAQNTLDTWASIVTNDTNSISIDPKFLDESISLKTPTDVNLQCPQQANVLYDIEENSRGLYTIMGAYTFFVYLGYNLELSEIIEPTNMNTPCAPNFVSVKYAVHNAGSMDYDFSIDPLTLHFGMTGEKEFDTTIVITSGMLEKFKTDTFLLKTNLDVSFAGNYYITSWIHSDNDTILSNDTLQTVYNSGKIKLPYFNDFTGSDSLKNLVIRSLTTNGEIWKVVPSGYDAIIQPDSGSNKLVFDADAGSVSQFSTNQIELNRTSRPTLRFWYAHDNQNPSSLDQILVKIMFDGDESTTKVIDYILRYDANYTAPTWVEHAIDLSSYVDSSCVIVIFEAISYGIAQHIDYISITSDQNLALDTMLLTDYSMCDLSNKELKVVLSNTIDQRVDFTQTPIDIVLEIRGDMIKDTVITIDSDGMEGLESDTIAIFSNFTLGLGDYTIKAYISTASADYYRIDDTITKPIAINPNYTIHIHNISRSGSPSQAGIDLRQEVTIKNTGNIPLPEIDLILSVDAEDIFPAYHFTATESTDDVLQPGDSITISFNSPYTTPWCAEYRVHVLAYLHCDTTLLVKEAAIPEYVDIDNLALININNPVLGEIDTVGSNINIKVTLENKSDATYFSNTAIHARIEDSKGNVILTIPETISEIINTLDSISYTFNTPYVVPDDSVYYITVFIDKQAQDNYQQDDTIRMKRTTDYKVGIGSIEPLKISMSQNFPNPANNSTIINYSIPEAGDVTFRIHSINGQLLYNKLVESEGGANTIEVNTSTLAAGIYMYSMEYKGQRVVKRMSIKR